MIDLKKLPTHPSQGTLIHACERLLLEAERHGAEYDQTERPGDLALSQANLEAAATLRKLVR